MIKSELIEKLSVTNPHLMHRDVEKIVNVIFEEITSGLWRVFHQTSARQGRAESAHGRPGSGAGKVRALFQDGQRAAHPAESARTSGGEA